MSGSRPHPWEAIYPPGLDWGTKIAAGTLTDMLDEAVAAYGDRPAFEFNGHRMSFAEFGAAVARAAAGLARLGAGPGRSVALYLANLPYHPIAFFAVLRTGARVVHLSPLDPPRALRYKMEDSESRILVTANLANLLTNAAILARDGVAAHLVVGTADAWGALPVPLSPLPEGAIDFATLGEAPMPPSWPSLTSDDVAVLQYTGGTTGLPRAAMLTHGNFTSAVAIYNAWLAGNGRASRPDDKIIGVLPYFHIYALTNVLLLGIRNGVEQLLRIRFDAETTLRDISEKRATNFPGVPTMWIALANHPDIEKYDLSSLRSIGSGGAPLPQEVAERLEKLTGHRLGGGWGMTETAPAGTSLMPGQIYTAGLIGVPLPGIEMDIVALDDPRRVLPPGERGEIRIKGPNVTKAYWKRPEETESAFVDGWLLTGDIGYMDEKGQFFLVDRKKDMIISGGFNVYPTMIENAIYEHPSVAEVIVIGVPDPYRGQAAKAFVTLREGAEPFTLEELRAFLADKLGRHELPTALEFRPSLPRTPVGKLSKRDLIEQEASQHTPGAPAPAS
ncbi:MAG: dicarboxylate--CoA ligase PimA [Acidibrevibacterium sp.]|uniref:dicarboxylate--CoA ligase PimA n=1 Tax=Acidibrevibacterium sp. TaxID=2606776 RepID=UPI003D03F559